MNQEEINKVKDLNATTLEELATLKTQYMQKVRDEGQVLLKREFAKFFEANPQVRVVTWVQYTPHFNDGDACTFSVHDLYGGSKDLTQEQIDDLPKYMGNGDGEEELGFESASGYQSDSAEGDSFKRYGTKYNSKAGYPFDAAKYAVLKSVDDAMDRLCARLRGHDDLMEMTFGDHVKVTATPAGFTIREIDHD